MARDLGQPGIEQHERTIGRVERYRRPGDSVPASMRPLASSASDDDVRGRRAIDDLARAVRVDAIDHRGIAGAHPQPSWRSTASAQMYFSCGSKNGRAVPSPSIA